MNGAKNGENVSSALGLHMEHIGESQKLALEMKQAKATAEKAEKDAKKAKLFAWFTFAVSTIISVASLIVSIIK